jgi:carbamoyltransferase
VIILGLNAFHGDSSAALVRDGKLIAAAEEERFRRIKHWAGFPVHSISYCLNQARVQLSDIEHIAFNQDNRANIMRKIGYFLFKRPNIHLVLNRLRNRRARATLPILLEQAFPGETLRAKLHCVEHHLAHLSSAFHVSPSIGRPLFPSMVSATFRVQPGAQRGARSRPMAEYISRIRSVSFIRP